MNAPDNRQPSHPPIENGRDILLSLYGEIGISAVAAALEMSRRPAPRPAERDPRDLPGVLRDRDLAA